LTLWEKDVKQLRDVSELEHETTTFSKQAWLVVLGKGKNGVPGAIVIH